MHAYPHNRRDFHYPRGKRPYCTLDDDWIPMAQPQPDPNNPPEGFHNELPDNARPPRKRPAGCGIWVAILVAIFIVIAIFARPDDDPDNQGGTQESETAVTTVQGDDDVETAE